MSSSTRFVFASLLFSTLGLGTASAGVHYGDPQSIRARVDGNITIDWWELPVSELILTPCAGGSDVHQTVNITYSPTTGVIVQQGTWCHVVLVPSGDFVLSGQTPDSYDLDITLDVGNISLNQGNQLNIVSGSSTETALFELFGQDWWDNQVAPYVGTGHDVSIDPNHARHASLVSSMQNGSTLAIASL
ncbi:MAG TPA: hypothetical protein PKW90_19730 [Myxococcota bacterium]|nr:hypothetical protein [Myxococcota bacterium]